MERVLPSLGFSNIQALNLISGNSPWDFAASYQGERVLVDASSHPTKSVKSKNAMASAIGLRFFVVMISPNDPEVFHLAEMRAGQVSVSVPREIIRKLEPKS